MVMSKVQYHICSHCGHRAVVNADNFSIEDNTLNFYCPECMNIDMGVELEYDYEPEIKDIVRIYQDRKNKCFYKICEGDEFTDENGDIYVKYTRFAYDHETVSKGLGIMSEGAMIVEALEELTIIR